MTLLPEWAPNIHPLLIHFPIVLLLLAPLLDVGAILFKKQRWLPKNANLVYAMAGLSVLIVYASGRIAADSVDLPTAAYSTLSTHANWALYTLILGGINAVLRGFQLFRKDAVKPFQWYLLIPGLVVVILLMLTADKGAKLVYAHGVGVSAAVTIDQHSATAQQGHHQAQEAQAQSHDEAGYEQHEHGDEQHEHGDEHTQGAEAVLGGSLQWFANQGIDPVQAFDWILGSPQTTDLQIIQTDQAVALSIQMTDQEALFVFPENVANLEFKARVNRDAFNGVIRLVHHLSNAQNYDFLEFDQTMVNQGRQTTNQVISFDSAEYHTTGWVTLKVVSTQGHFRGYVDQNLLTHGHGGDQPPGRVGLYLKGSGTVKIANLQGTVLQ